MYQSYIWPGALERRGQKNIFLKWIKNKLVKTFKKVEAIDKRL